MTVEIKLPTVIERVEKGRIGKYIIHLYENVLMKHSTVCNEYIIIYEDLISVL